MPALSETHARLKKVLVHALGVEEDDVQPAATVLGDLGAASTDLLDITFRLEREFGIKIPSGELFPDLASPDAPAYIRDGRLTDDGLAALRSQMPYADLSDRERDRRLNRIDDLYTVELLANYIDWKLSRNRDADDDAAEPILATAGPILH
jgi:acyl carrier protein